MPGRPGQFNPDQYKFDFEGGNRTPDFDKDKKDAVPEAELHPHTQEGVEIHERDECEACGNALESYSSCFQCRSNKKKLEWLGKQGKNKSH